MTELYYSIVLPGEKPISNFQLRLEDKHFLDSSKPGVIRIEENICVSLNEVDECFIKTLYGQDFLELKEFLDFHFHEYDGDKLNYLKRTRYLLDNYFEKGNIVYNQIDFAIQAYRDNPKTKEILDWMDLKLDEYKNLSELTKKPKLEWLGTASQFGYIFLELAEKGFIKIPQTSGQESYRKYAAYCNQLFNVNTPFANLVKELNPKSNSLTYANREEFSIPLKSKLSKS